MKHFFSTFIPNLLRCFSLRYIPWHILAVAITCIVVTTNLDWHYFLTFRSELLSILFLPALIIGGLLPIILPIVLLVIGTMRGNKILKINALALAQSAIIGSIISSTYKAFTGRVQPDLYNLAIDSSHQFNFGFLEHGIFWGWPSSHTTIAFATTVTLIYLYPHIKKLKWSALLYAFYIGFGVSISIHWFSEFIAGAIIGSVIGVVVGKSFQRQFHK